MAGHFLRPVSNTVTAVAIAVAVSLVGCEADSGSIDETDANGIESDANATPTEPREPDELPGANTEPGEDPCESDATCHWEARGVGTTAPFDEENVTGAHLDDEGAVTLDDEAIHDYVAWIPNTAAGTISRLDTESRAEVGRYFTGPTGEQMSPSRTSVGPDGSVYIANRDGQRITKFALPPECPGTSGGEAPTTSTGPDDVYDWGDDDCLVWSEELTGYGPLRAVAAQQDGDDSVVWVGARDHSIWKLDGDDGTVLFRTDSPVQPDGFAIDDLGNLWIATFYESKLGRIDTTRCRDHGSCDTEICDSVDGDCAKKSLDTPAMAKGITVDADQNIWLGGDLMRYDRQAPPGERWHHIDPDATIEGLVADENWIYGAAGGDGVMRFLRENPEQSATISGTVNRSVSALDIDHAGFVWAINRDHNDAFVVEPGDGIFDGQVDDQVAGFDEPDAYSDMIESVIRFPTRQLGIFRQIFEQCDPNEHFHTEWQTLRFDAAAPEPSRLEWRVRGATSKEGLDAAPWLEIGHTPPTSSPIDLRSVLAESELERIDVIEIETRLRPGQDGDEFYVPRLLSTDVIAECPEIIN